MVYGPKEGRAAFENSRIRFTDKAGGTQCPNLPRDIRAWRQRHSMAQTQKGDREIHVVVSARRGPGTGTRDKNFILQPPARVNDLAL